MRQWLPPVHSFPCRQKFTSISCILLQAVIYVVYSFPFQAEIQSDGMYHVIESVLEVQWRLQDCSTCCGLVHHFLVEKASAALDLDLGVLSSALV